MKPLTAKNSKNVERFNRVVKEAVDYCFYDRTPEERALMLIEVRAINSKEIQELSDMMELSIGENFARLTLAEMLLKMRMADDFKDTLSRGEA